jgi:hypothetical protein
LSKDASCRWIDRSIFDSSANIPHHIVSSAFNATRAKNQNISVGVSFGACRELAFLRATEPNDAKDECRLYFPQPNNGVFAFGRDANIQWKHGINALPESEQQDGKGRISIILWGLASNVIEEEGSPDMLGSGGHQGPHANKNNNRQQKRQRQQKPQRQSQHNRGKNENVNGKQNETKNEEKADSVNQDLNEAVMDA